MSKFAELVGIAHPIIQSPMAGISTVRLAAAVSNSGALGSIPFALIDLRNGADPVRAQLTEYNKLTGGKPVNINFFSQDFETQVAPLALALENWHKLYEEAGVASARHLVPQLANSNISIKQIESEYPDRLEELIELVKEFQPRVVSFHFGVPSSDSIKQFQSAGSFVLACVTSVQEAKYVIDAGVDAVVCQGYEAGGHRGNFLTSQRLDENLSTSSLFQQVKRLVDELNTKTFIVVAGGIGDRKTVKLYIDAGASAVQVGTPFITTPESLANDFIKQTVRDKAHIPTIVTELVSGRPARTLRTPFIQQLVEARGQVNGNLPAYGWSYSGFKKLAGELGREYGFYLAGQNYHSLDPDADSAAVVRSLIP